MSVEVHLQVRPARLGDVPAMVALIGGYADQGVMLPRTAGELYESIRDFLVIEAEPGGLAACAAVHIFTRSIAELKSLAVSQHIHGQGLGRRIVEACCDQGRELGLERLFCLTYQVVFFQRLGWERVDRSRLPEKVWSECVRCNKFLACDEVALWRRL
jgi:amino-acid N-acetyltransferase